MRPFSKSYKFEYILVAVDYVSKWAEAQALPTNDARVVVTFLKKLFCRFEMPKALISDRGTHFCNKIMERTMKRYGVNHRISTSYHPQTSGQVENTNIAFKIILEKTVKDNLAICINITTAEPVTTASAPVTAAGVSVSTTEPSTPPTTTILIKDEDLTIAQTLMKMISVKSKEKNRALDS
ncbi:reverse transcriptase domain-containing protein [Tanacetum coccineum]